MDGEGRGRERKEEEDAGPGDEAFKYACAHSSTRGERKVPHDHPFPLVAHARYTSDKPPVSIGTCCLITDLADTQSRKFIQSTIVCNPYPPDFIPSHPLLISIHPVHALSPLLATVGLMHATAEACDPYHDTSNACPPRPSDSHVAAVAPHASYIHSWAASGTLASISSHAPFRVQCVYLSVTCVSALIDHDNVRVRQRGLPLARDRRLGDTAVRSLLLLWRRHCRRDRNGLQVGSQLLQSSERR